MDTGTIARATIPAAERRRSLRPEVQATRMRILRAAERLYAERGFDGVSLREIAIAANQGNNNAVQYHFGSRENLIEAIFQNRVEEMEDERHALLDAAEAEGRTRDVATLLAIGSMPHLSLCDERGHHPHAGFMLHYLIRRRHAAPSTDGPDVVTEAAAATRLFLMLRACVPPMPDDIAETRIRLCALMFLNLLVQHDSANLERGDPVSLARHASDTIRAMTAALCEPCTEKA